MSSARKIFIYQDSYTAEYSIADCRTLFSNETLFGTRPDIQVGPFHFNTDGLEMPLFVVPGGAAVGMSSRVSQQMQAVTRQLGNHYHYLGICAGGILATQTADIFETAYHKYNSSCYRIPEHIFSLESTTVAGSTLNILSDYKSLAPFYPTDAHAQLNFDKKYFPYRVKLHLATSQNTLEQLYVAGPAFISQANITTASQSEVIAHYKDRDGYAFFYEDSPRFFRAPAAIIAQRASQTSGGRLITGTHIETCVPGSQLLAKCAESSAITEPLPTADHQALLSQQVETRTVIDNLLRRTFNP